MFEKKNYGENLSENYELLIKQLEALTDDVLDDVANLSNASALLNQFLDEINWVGFYLFKNDQLILGPFQGLPACTKIPIGRGVCGTSAKNLETLVVPNVHEFEGHIACDSASNSEIVLPILKNGVLYGVLDIDSPIFNRFSDVDQLYLEKFVDTLVRSLI